MGQEKMGENRSVSRCVGLLELTKAMTVVSGKGGKVVGKWEDTEGMPL